MCDNRLLRFVFFAQKIIKKILPKTNDTNFKIISNDTVADRKSKVGIIMTMTIHVQ